GPGGPGGEFGRGPGGGGPGGAGPGGPPRQEVRGTPKSGEPPQGPDFRRDSRGPGYLEAKIAEILTDVQEAAIKKLGGKEFRANR
ncbi:MAG TPA: hypothetical protein PLX06_06815, partial [Fimbriimonadaceae bacterium]|nr:hypothetical protein [Fimbriimonadaceae bacterium]